MNDHYRTLGVSKDATEEEIKSAFRKLVKEWHPDRNPDPQATEKIKEINEAYGILSDKEKRRQYDAPSHRWHSNAGFNSENLDDIIAAMWGFERNSRTEAHVTAYQATITLKEAYTGCSRRIKDEVIDIPPGVRNGNMLRIKGKILTLNVLPDGKFARQGDNLYYEYLVNPVLLMLGGEVTIKHLDDKSYKLSIPPHTQDSSIFKLRNKGMKSPEIKGLIGDLFVVVKSLIPSNLTNHQRDILQEYLRSIEEK